jgi:hypothetical protein
VDGANTAGARWLFAGLARVLFVLHFLPLIPPDRSFSTLIGGLLPLAMGLAAACGVAVGQAR